MVKLLGPGTNIFTKSQIYLYINVDCVTNFSRYVKGDVYTVIVFYRMN